MTDSPRDTEGPDLAKQAMAGGRWSLVSQLGRQGVRLVFSFILARLLGPENFGIVALATVYVTFITLFLDTGFATAIVQRETIDRTDIGSAMVMNLVLSCALALLTFGLAPYISKFFNTSQLTDVLRALALIAVAKGLSAVPSALLMRHLRFRILALGEVATGLAGGVIGVTMALAGADYWSLVAQSLSTELLFAVVVLVVTRTVGDRPRWTNIVSMWRFSINAIGAHALSYSMRNADNLLVGRYLGVVPLAHYALSYRVMMLPLQSFTQAVNRVALPLYARKQSDLGYVQRNFLFTTRMVSLVTFPVMTAIAVSAPDLVPTLFGNAWRPAIVPMQLLALVGLRQSVQSLVQSVVIASGRTHWQFRMNLVWSVLAIAGFAIGVQWGINGVAGAYLAVDLLMAPMTVFYAAKILAFTARQYLATLVPPAIGSLMLAFTYSAVRFGFTDAGSTGTIAMAVGLPVAGLAYLLLLRLRWPELLSEGKSFGRRFVGLRSQPAEQSATSHRHGG